MGAKTKHSIFLKRFGYLKLPTIAVESARMGFNDAPVNGNAIATQLMTPNPHIKIQELKHQYVNLKCNYLFEKKMKRPKDCKLLQISQKL